MATRLTSTPHISLQPVLHRKSRGRWWRAYDDTLNDPKVQELPDGLFKFWFNILCIASKHDGKLPDNKTLTYLLRGRCDHVVARLNELVNRGLIDNVHGELIPHNWFERQYKSDLSTDRVAKHRNVSKPFHETLTETEADTESERKKENGLSTSKKVVNWGVMR